MGCINKHAYKHKNKRTNIKENDEQYKDVKQLWTNGHILNNNKLVCPAKHDK